MIFLFILQYLRERTTHAPTPETLTATLEVKPTERTEAEEQKTRSKSQMIEDACPNSVQ